MMTYSITRRFLAPLAALCLGGAAACVDLTETPITGITSAYYTTPSGFDAAVNAMYTPLKTHLPLERGATMTVFGTDEFQKGADGGYKFFNDYTSALNGDVDMIRNLWTDYYRGINTANTVLDAAKTAKVPAATLALRVGEAQFLRAYYYFTLVRTYGDVPLYLTPTAGVQTATNRDPAAKVYETIVADLKAAETALPDKAAQYGRADRPAVQHLLAEVYLTRNAPGDMALAEAEAKLVVANPRFKLLPTEKQNWDFGNELNSEVVWAIQEVADPIANGASAGYGNKLHLYFGFPYDQEPGMLRDIANDRPFKRFRPTTWLLGLWNTPGTTNLTTPDQRYQDIFKVTWFANNPNNTGYKLGDGTVITPKYNIGDTSIFFPSREVTTAERKSVKYKMYAPSEYNDAIFPVLNKYLDPSRTSTNQEDGQRDLPVMRLANTILMLAEAQFNQGKLPEATANINLIRTRAAKPGRAAEMQITPAQLSLDFILDERARELTGETTRWFDLTRTHKLVERVKKYNPGGAPNVQACHELRPIPTSEILLSTGTMKQNPCY
jgi:SusD family.